MELYQINFVEGIPVYRQLVDRLRTSIKNGTLTDGEQLPTVRDLSQQLSLAQGTVKRAYDELERLGLVEKIQGRGTFVCYQAPSAAGRKEQAMAAIDAMLDSMGSLGFSMEEAKIFLDLKLRERESRESKVKVAVVECNPENLSRLSGQLRSVSGVELYSYLIDHIRTYPYNLGEEMDLVVTTVEHAEYIQSILPEQKKIARIALRLSPDSMAQIVKIGADETVGIVGCSLRFAELLQMAYGAYAEISSVDRPLEFSEPEKLRAYLRGKTAVLVPEDVEKYIGMESAAVLRNFADRGKVIRCAYEMDEGSFLFLQEKIGRLREKKMK